MSKSIFISCVYEDSHQIETIRNWNREGRLGDVVITHETEDKRLLGVEMIKNHIMNKIRGAGTVFVLIGNDTHNHDWIRAEVELANSFHKRIVCIRLPQTTGGVPEILRNFKVVTFEPGAIKNAIL